MFLLDLFIRRPWPVLEMRLHRTMPESTICTILIAEQIIQLHGVRSYAVRLRSIYM